jgi:acetyl esterase
MIHPQVRGLLRMMAAAKIKPVQDMTPLEAREFTESGAKSNINSRPAIETVYDLSILGSAGNIVLRIYRPSSKSLLPGIVFFHGGGHVVGSLNSEDVTARFLCSGVEAVVVSVDYRLAPEHKFPAAVIDAFDATRWVIENADLLGIDLNKFGLAGDSAGGNLATVVAIMARDEKITAAQDESNSNSVKWPDIKLQALIYPIVDFGMQDSTYDEYSSGFGIISKAALHWFRNHYLNTADDIEDWRASPIKTKDLSGVAPVFMVAAENDCLKGEGIRYAEKLKQAGVPVERVEYQGMNHTFFVMVPAIDDATKAQLAVCAAFRKAFDLTVE